MNDQLKHYADKLKYEIDSADLKAALDAGDRVVVIDTRSLEAFQTEHIPGALNIPHRAMSAETTAHVDGDALVIAYCDGIGCNGSTKGAIKMLELGFRVRELMGGLDWWKRDGHKTHGTGGSGGMSRCNCG